FGLGIVLYELLAGAPPYRLPGEGETASLLALIQRERFERVRRVAPGTPRWLARLVRQLLRARPRSRPASAQRVRRLLERRLRAFPADARLELASWLWEEGVFQPREGDTVVLSPEPARRRFARLGRGLAWGAAVGCALALGAIAYAPSLVPPLRPLAAHVRFAGEQRLRVAVDGAPAEAVEPGAERALAPGRHQLRLEWPSGARQELELELAPGEARSLQLSPPPQS
ncbi:MAG TPA: hypothetical protein VEI82_10985, partial [Myxococcota bacterium]|nr:hypothetical protein [Myxococcota bacterium]